MRKRNLFVTTVLCMIALVSSGCNECVKHVKELKQNTIIIAAYKDENSILDRKNRELETDLKSARIDIQSLKDQKTKVEEFNRKVTADLIAELKKENVGGIIETGPEGQLILKGEVFFNSGKSTLTKNGKAALKVLADKMSGRNETMRIDGHTDNQPIKVSGYKSNWDLSGSRAISVVRFLMENGINPKRLFFAGFGEFRPMASNKTKDGKKKNRRVEIRILKSGS